MKKLIIWTFLLIVGIFYSQEFRVQKTEVSYLGDKWQKLDENAFIKSVNLLEGGSLQLFLYNDQWTYIAFGDTESKIIEDGILLVECSPTNNYDKYGLTLVFSNGKLFFGTGYIVGWDKNEPNKIMFYRLWF